jgi:hypothetical protein
LIGNNAYRIDIPASIYIRGNKQEELKSEILKHSSSLEEKDIYTYEKDNS